MSKTDETKMILNARVGMLERKVKVIEDTFKVGTEVRNLAEMDSEMGEMVTHMGDLESEILRLDGMVTSQRQLIAEMEATGMRLHDENAELTKAGAGIRAQDEDLVRKENVMLKAQVQQYRIRLDNIGFALTGLVTVANPNEPF